MYETSKHLMEMVTLKNIEMSLSDTKTLRLFFIYMNAQLLAKLGFMVRVLIISMKTIISFNDEVIISYHLSLTWMRLNTW